MAALIAVLGACASIAPGNDVLPVASGPVLDAECNMETVELANDAQLHALLVELSETTFFRLIHVNMDTKCPYWGAPEEEPACESKAEETAVPLCTLGTDEGAADPFGADPFGAAAFSGGAPPASPFGEAAMFAPTTSDPVDPTITPEEDAAQTAFRDEDCSDEELPSFWLDMCNHIPTDSSEYVNLQLNPERYTGYNGSHVWAAIYEENCLVRTGGSEVNTCYEERVLYRLLSGMHVATNTHIARFYHAPSKRKNRTEWEPNLDYFSRQFAGHPERLKNLHFAFVVLLRALSRARAYLVTYSYASGDRAEADRVSTLVRRLLDTPVLHSCGPLFDAFDETLLFREQQAPWWSLKKQFKGVFQNVSRVIDCVSCQKCKLHAKVTMLGFGSALKMLLLPRDLLPTAISRDEVVALVNTLYKFSTAIRHVKELTALQYRTLISKSALPPNTDTRVPTDGVLRRVTATVTPPSAAIDAGSGPAVAAPLRADGGVVSEDVADLLDGALSVLSRLSSSGALDEAVERQAVARALGADMRTLLLAKHFGGRPTFGTLLKAALALPPLTSSAALGSSAPAGMARGGGVGAAGSSAGSATGAADVLVLGSGVAGLTATLRLLDAGARVVLMDKEKRLGGNSAKASSGINSCCPEHSRTARNANDTALTFAADTAKSAKRDAGGLITTLTASSAAAIDWLRSRTTIDLSQVAQLGGHSHARTHRPSNGMVGAELVYALQKEVKSFEGSGRLSLMTSCRASRLLQDASGAVSGVAYRRQGDDAEHTLLVPHTVLATGGFANDRTETSLLAKHRPDLLSYPTTNGEWASGDGMKMAMAIGAGSVDMEHVQIHPTGFVDMSSPDAPTKVLCGEMMRGVGGLLLTPSGARFVNELAPRDKVVEAQLATGAAAFAIVLNEAAAREAGKHVELYTRKGLLVELHGTAELARWMSAPPSTDAAAAAPPPPEASALEAALNATFGSYNAAASAGFDSYGKKYFHNTPFEMEGTLRAGWVVPVLHYTMGGITMDATGAVLRADGSPIPNLHAAGEVTGGVHGHNRLGGNSLLECVVFGSIVGNKLASVVKQRRDEAAAAAEALSAAPAVRAVPASSTAGGGSKLRHVDRAELAMHTTSDDLWVSLYGRVYDFTSFLDDHPAGPESIIKLGGTDGTDMYQTVHNEGMLEDFHADLVGVLGE